MADDLDAPALAHLVYSDINGRTSSYEDFEPSQLDQSRQYFDLATPELRTRPFDVLTCIVGLEVPAGLQEALTRRLDDLLGLLPSSARVYRVRPDLLHWEAHIIRRPGEPPPPVSTEQITESFNAAVSGARPFDMTYKGVFVSPDGTIAVQGYGQTAELRSRLRDALPFSSLRQNETGHISVARILDPIGTASFGRLQEARAAGENEVYGALPVGEVKLVRERRWYMEDYAVVASAQLRG